MKKATTTETSVSFSSRVLAFCLLLLWAMRGQTGPYQHHQQSSGSTRAHKDSWVLCIGENAARSTHMQRLCTRMQKHKNCPSVSHCTTPLNPRTLTFSPRVCFMSDQHYIRVAKLKRNKNNNKIVSAFSHFLLLNSPSLCGAAATQKHLDPNRVRNQPLSATT